MAEDKVCVFDIQKFSVHDGPGIRTIVFTKGCPMHCEWCANPESIKAEPELMYYPDKCIGCGRCEEVCPTGAAFVTDDGMHTHDPRKCTNCGKCTEECYANARKMTGDMMTREEIIEEVDKDMSFYKNSGGGITFSGGEAMIYPEFVRDVAKHYKEQEVSTCIETCGQVPWENYDKAVDYLDIILFDIKMMDDEKHQKYCKGSNKRILENIKKASERTEVVIRTPIIPGVNDSKEEIDEEAKWIVENLGTDTKMHILPYHNYGTSKYNALCIPYPMGDLEAPSDEHMADIKEQLEGYGLDVTIGG